MFHSCLCSGGGKKSKKNLHELTEAQIIQSRIRDFECRMLSFIFRDISRRSPQPTLAYHNFITFLSLTGLWGDKLFQYFNMNKNGKITQKQFLYGMARTIKAPEEEKIEILYNFFTDAKECGITYSQFLKMLYHFSKDELRELMANDGVFIHESIIPCGIISQKVDNQVICVKLEKQPQIAQQSTFEKAYENILSQSESQGTMMKIKTQINTYELNYSNMLDLTKEYAKHVYAKYRINPHKEGMKFPEFREWIRNNQSLFTNYFAAFHAEIWSEKNKIPAFLSHIDCQCRVETEEGQLHQTEWMMLVGSAILFAPEQKNKTMITKIIWLYELSIKKVEKEGVHGITIRHSCKSYKPMTLLFKTQHTKDQWLQRLKQFEKNYLHEKYEVGAAIGTGRYSTVYKCQSRESKKEFALKVLDLEKLEQRQKLAIENESTLLKVIKCPAIIKYYETIHSRRHIYMVTEYIEGCDLFEYVKREKRLTQYEAALLLGRIIQAVQHLHALEIIHRDLKPENIMVVVEEECSEVKSHPVLPTRIDNIKIIDFGFACYVSTLKSQQNSYAGTLNYMAPEVLLGQPASYESDVFAIGSILYFMLRGRYAFESTEKDGIAQRTVDGDYNLYDYVWEQVTEEAKELIERLLIVDPVKRITLNEAINHPWFQIAKSDFNKTEKSI